ncbi:MAG: hypothetical protein ACYC5S_05090 [Thiobacillus sp.]
MTVAMTMMIFDDTRCRLGSGEKGTMTPASEAHVTKAENFVYSRTTCDGKRHFGSCATNQGGETTRYGCSLRLVSQKQKGCIAMKEPVDAYLEKASQLTEEETERLLARMRSRLMRRLEDKKMSVQEVVAIQLAIEDEALQEWRTRMTEIRKKPKNK